MHSATWRAVAPARLAFREWDDEIVVYDDSTGSTHRLTPLAAQILRSLVRHPSGIVTDDLVAAIAPSTTIEDDVSVASQVGRILAQLAELGLAVEDRP
jgi:PqqD family protein of HPr-rel-A system